MRLYIGIDLPAVVKHSLYEAQMRLKKLGIEGSWKSPEYFHITLEFFGELLPESIPALAEIVESVISEKQAFKLHVNELGAFPSFQRPNTIWAGVGGSTKKLDQLWIELHDELIKNGFVLQKLPFKPHISLISRLKNSKADLSSFSFGKPTKFTVSEVIVLESKVVEGKRAYPALYRAKLKTGENPTLV